MNKKKLSVVMAGAMLASSVAPVLAAEVTKTETSADNLGLLMQNVRTKLNSVKFADESRNGTSRGKSIYFVKIDGETKNLDVNSDQAAYQTVFKNLKPGQKVEIWTKAHVVETVDGVDKYYAYKESAKTYTDTELTGLVTTLYGSSTVQDPYKNIITKAETTGSGDSTKLTITFDNTTATWLPNTLVLEVGAEELDFDKYIDRDTKEEKDMPTGANSVAAANFDGFPKAAKDKVAVTDGKEKVEEITITSGGNNVSVDDIYDGVMLTTEGHDFFAAIKEAEALRGTTRALKGNAKGGTTTITQKSDIANAIVEIDGKYSFSIEVPAGTVVTEPAMFTVVGTNEKATERMAEWILAGHAKVDILAGSNRYATAVQIAKEYAGLTGETVANNGLSADIVLVNGNALVDGLAAAPLASSLGLKADGSAASTKHRAPILLSESDRLPKETKAYLKEVLSNVEIGKLKTATVHLVGGESVLNKSLERELKSLGFSVERYGGDNREETSLKVAEAVIDNQKTYATNDAFVVGANGEADAMSIAAIASTNKTPIIVAKNGGISEDAIYELRDKNVTIIGGKSAVTKAEEEEIGLEAKKVSRIEGANRQATNAAIIAKYYTGTFGNAKNVIVAKDGQHNKMELVDALAAANFASEKQAPIVLATNKLSDAQINALELNAGATAETLYQVGIGVDKDNVVKVIAQRLGLAN